MHGISTDEPRKVVSEWVLTMSKGDSVIITESQFEYYRERVESADYSKIFFPKWMVNPPFVVSAFERPAEYIKNQYPCPKCHQGGYDPDDSSFWCSQCEGSGVQLP